MRTGHAVVVHGQTFEVREVTVPDPAPETILLRQEMAGICGTDLHNWQKGFAEPTFLGHENVGVIEAIGSGVTHDYVGNPLVEGDRVIFHPRRAGFSHGFQPERPGLPPFSGGFGDYIYLTDPTACFIKTSAPAQVAVLIEPFTIGVHAVLRANVQLGDTVIVQGSGAIGLLTAAAARLAGAAKVIVVGGPARRLELALRMGADVTVDIAAVPDMAERKEIVLAHTPRGAGADIVFECAGFLPAVAEGLEYIRQDGVFVEVGHFVDTGTVTISPHRHLLRRNLRLEGVWGSQPSHFVRGLPLLERGDFPYAEMVSHILPLSEARRGFDALNGSYQLDGDTVIKIALHGDAASS
ncbi:MAG: zinc-binding dehydrogenase [Caldilineaceae bacterium]|nr:zinc-binding dehydrogenase [Caldilineaceae bacterium]